MSKEIKNLKNQLKEVAEVLNTFKSEKIQLKILKLFVKEGYLDVEMASKIKQEKAEAPAELKVDKKKRAGRKRAASASIPLETVAEASDAATPPMQPEEKPAKSTALKVLKTRNKKKAATESAQAPAVKTRQPRAKKANAAETAVKPKAKVGRPRKSDKATAPAAEPTSKSSSPRAVKGKTAATKKTGPAKGKIRQPGRPTAANNRPGPTSVLLSLSEEGFFNQARGLSDIIDHCNKTQGWILKSTDISGILLNMVRKNILERRKNESNGKFVYIKA